MQPPISSGNRRSVRPGTQAHYEFTVSPLRAPSRGIDRSIVGIAFFASCTRGESHGARRNENPQTRAPEKLTSVQGIPATEIEALIQRKLDGPRLHRIDEDEWGHTKRLYKLYGNNPLWLTPDGLHKIRAKALTEAILGANADGMRLIFRTHRFAGDRVAVRTPPDAHHVHDLP